MENHSVSYPGRGWLEAVRAFQILQVLSLLPVMTKSPS